MARRKPIEHSSFFKILFKDSTRQLKLPRDFAREHIKVLPENAKLKISSGESWDVKMEKIDQENIYFSRGWMEFVEDTGLETFDFLVFKWYINKSTFKVSGYGKNGCEKEIFRRVCDRLGNSSGEAAGLNNGVRGKHERESKMIKSFTLVIKKYKKYYTDIPISFAVATGIAKKNEIKLQNVKGEKWPVEIRIRTDGRICMGGGWMVFREANKLSFGDEIKFEFDESSGNLILKKEIKTENVLIKRGRGRPRK